MWSTWHLMTSLSMGAEVGSSHVVEGGGGRLHGGARLE